jgi:hypothetical protein
VLRDDGQFVLACHAKDEAKAGDFPESVYRFYTPDEVVLLLDESGFPRVDVVRTADGLIAATAYRLPHRVSSGVTRINEVP